MKTTTIFIIVTVLQLVCLGLIAVNFMESNDRDRLKQVEIDGLNKRIKEQADSMTRELFLIREYSSKQADSIKQSKKERIEAHERSQKTIRDLQRIVYIQHTDSSRNKALSQLYKTYKP